MPVYFLLEHCWVGNVGGRWMVGLDYLGDCFQPQWFYDCMIFLLTNVTSIITLSSNISITLHLFSIYYSFLQMPRSALIFLASPTVALNLCSLYFSKAKSFAIFFCYLDLFSCIYYYSFYLLRTVFQTRLFLSRSSMCAFKL